MTHDRRTLGWLAIAAVLGLGVKVLATVQSQRVDSDPTVSTWGLDRIDQAAGTDGFFHYDATGKGVNIFVVGTGVLRTHDDFQNASGTRVHYVGDFCKPNEADPRTTSMELDPGDFQRGHDTHNASFAAGKVSGVSKDAQIYSLRVTWQSAIGIDANGGSDCDDQSAVAKAINWIRIHGHDPDSIGVWRPAVINYSGGSGTDVVRTAIQNAYADGYLVILSGNSANGSVYHNWGTCPADPTNLSCVPRQALVVGGTKIDDSPLFSGYGPGLGLYAPANNLRGASKLGNSTYDILDAETGCGCGGDSFAAPFVAGVAAAYLQQHPGASSLQVRTRILNTATPHLAGFEPNTGLLQSAPATLTSLRRPADYDGDGKTDRAATSPCLRF